MSYVAMPLTSWLESSRHSTAQLSISWRVSSEKAYFYENLSITFSLTNSIFGLILPFVALGHFIIRFTTMLVEIKHIYGI